MRDSAPHSDFESHVATAIHAVDLDAIRFTEEPSTWAAVFDRLHYQEVAYGRRMIDYQHEYLGSAGRIVHDASMVLRSDRRPCALLLLTIEQEDDKFTLSAAGAALAGPAFGVGTSARIAERLTRQTLDFIIELGTQLRIQTLTFEQSPAPGTDQIGITDWHRSLMAAGAQVSVRHDLFVDLAPDMPTIRLGFRKSYRPLVNVGLRTWAAGIMDSACVSEACWSEFRDLHRNVAGRDTRSAATWQQQYRMILANEAFLVYLRDPATDKLVGGGFFQITRDEGLYAVAAYDRELFDKPLGHVVQQLAIEEMKKRGLRWYRVGERSYPSDRPPPTEKQLSISQFKQGFSSHQFVRFQFNLKSGVRPCD